MTEAAELKAGDVVRVERGDAVLWVREDTGEIVDVYRHEVRFHVHDRDSADWVLSKLSDAEVEVSALKLRREALLANLDAQILQAEREVASLRYRFADELEAWCRSELEGSKRRSVQLDNGRLALRKTPPKLVVDDETAACDWALSHYPDAVAVSYRFRKSEVPDGEVPPGCSMEPAGETFSVSTGV